MPITSTTTTGLIATSSSLLSPQWVRRITSSSNPRRSSTNTSRVVMVSKSASSVDSKKRGEEISGWWRSISCAYFGGAQEKCMGRKNWMMKGGTAGGGGQKAFFFSQPNDMGSITKDGSDHHPHHNHILRSSSSSEQQQPSHQPPQSTKLLTLPTILTLGRVAAVPILVSTFYMNSWWATTATTSIFVVAAITDWLDGYIARKMRLGTAFGAFLDPVADKLMVAATLVLLCTRPLEYAPFGEIPWLLPVPSIAIIGREITMSAVREWAASQNGKVLEAVAVNNLGKWKTASQMIALTLLLASRDSSLLGKDILVPSGVALLYVSAGLAVWSLAVYMKKIWRVLLKL